MSLLGDFVRARRRAGRLTQRQLAELARVGERFVRELEQGKPTVRLEEVNAVLAVFGKRVGIEDLPPDHEQPAPSRQEPGK